MRNIDEVKQEIARLKAVISLLTETNEEKFRIEILVNQACHDSLVWSLGD